MLYNLATSLTATVFILLLLWIVFKIFRYVIIAIGYGKFLEQPTFLIALYVILALTMLLNAIGLFRALSHIELINALNIKPFLLYISKKILVLSYSCAVTVVLVKRHPSARWLSAIFVTGMLLWIIYYSYQSPPGLVKNPLFEPRNVEMAKNGAIQFRASFMAFLVLLLGNILFSRAAASFFANTGQHMKDEPNSSDSARESHETV